MRANPNGCRSIRYASGPKRAELARAMRGRGIGSDRDGSNLRRGLETVGRSDGGQAVLGTSENR